MVEPDEPSCRSGASASCSGVSRSSLYYEPAAASAEELALMRRIDELHLEYPFYGSRKLARRASRARATRRTASACSG